MSDEIVLEARNLARHYAISRGPFAAPALVRALDGVSSEWIDRTREGLERRRLNAFVDCVDLELKLGRHRALVPELSDLVARHPTVEPLAGQPGVVGTGHTEDTSFTALDPQALLERLLPV